MIKWRKCGGSITVEAALIVPIVIIAVMILLQILLILFQSCIMQTTANYISEGAAAVWLDPHASFETGKTAKKDIAELGLYRRWNFNGSRDLDELQGTAKAILNRFSILKSRNTQVRITHQNMVLAQKLTVEITASYSNPLGGLTRIWGVGNTTNLAVQSHIIVDDPAEFIRNTDFIIDTAAKVPAISEFKGKWNEIVTKIVEYVKSLNKGEGQIGQ